MSKCQQMVAYVREHKLGVLYGICLVFLLTIFLCPNVAQAVSLEDQLDRVNTLTTDKIKKYGISGAAILSVIGAIIKGNIKLAGIAIVIAVMLALFLSWVAGGMLV